MEQLLDVFNLPSSKLRKRDKNSRMVTFSKNVFIPVTNACRNNCSYCGFRSPRPRIMSRSEVARMLELGRDHNCKEALFTLGEQPESVREIRNELRKWGYSSIAEYLLDLCKDALKYGLLPHSNIGVSTPEDLRALKDVNASMGLMLESASERLCGEGMPHEFSPGKRPDIRLGFIEEAGKLGIPFTTGLLIGIGETDEEIVESLIALRKLHERFGHIQELIVQNFVPHPGTRMEKAKAPSFERMLKTLYVSKAALPGVSIQVPPNLHKDWRTFIAYGADDLGGISPVTEDYINPGHAWPDLKHVESVITGMGLNLRQRLPIYPKYIKLGWYSDEIAHLIESYTDEDGLVKDVVID